MLRLKELVTSIDVVALESYLATEDAGLCNKICVNDDIAEKYELIPNDVDGQVGGALARIFFNVNDYFGIGISFIGKDGLYGVFGFVDRKRVEISSRLAVRV